MLLNCLPIHIAVSSTALSNAANSVSGYTAGTLGAMMHDCVKWVFTGQRALKQAQERQTVLQLAQPKREHAHDAPSCPLSKFITTVASQGGVIALTNTKITRQHDIVGFSQATACRQILWSDGPWTGREIQPAWENYYELQGYKQTATCKECGFEKQCVLTSLTPTEVPPSPPSPPPSSVVLHQMCLARSLCSCTRTAARPYDDELGQCEQDLCKYPAGHSRAQQTRASCLLSRVLALHRFLALQRNNTRWS